MARPLRIEFEGALYHLLARGNARQRIFQGEADRERFLALLGESLGRFGVSLHGFVLMPNHFHLLAQTHRGNLSRWMHWLMVAYTVYSNRRHDRSGHLFQGRYKSFLVEEGDYLLSLSRYLHLNPVRGLGLGRGDPMERRKRLRSFGWSSYRGYAGLAAQWPFVEENLVLDEFGDRNRAPRLAYRRFVEEGLSREVVNPFEAVQWQSVLGSESFVQKVRDRVRGGGRKATREMTSLRRAARAVAPEEVLQKVARKYGVTLEQLGRKGPRGLVAKGVAMWMLWELSGLRLREIGERFDGMDYAAVAQRIRRTRQSHRPGEREALLREMSNV
jgi:putative transposase